MDLLFSPMNIIFNEFGLVALIVAVPIANKIAHDGKSNWLEGIQLMLMYLIMAASFFILESNQTKKARHEA